MGLVDGEGRGRRGASGGGGEVDGAGDVAGDDAALRGPVERLAERVADADERRRRARRWTGCGLGRSSCSWAPAQDSAPSAEGGLDVAGGEGAEASGAEVLGEDRARPAVHGERGGERARSWAGRTWLYQWSRSWATVIVPSCDGEAVVEVAEQVPERALGFGLGGWGTNAGSACARRCRTTLTCATHRSVWRSRYTEPSPLPRVRRRAVSASASAVLVRSSLSHAVSHAQRN